MPVPVARPLRVIALLSLSAVLSLSACGGDDGSATSTEQASAPGDATAFKDCLLSGSVDRGIYEEVKRPAPAVTALADELGADFFEAAKADDGIAFFYVFEDDGAAQDAVPQVEDVIGQLAAALSASGAKAASQLGTPVVTADGPVALGLLPFDSAKESELSEEASADVTSCLAEIQ